MATAIKEKRRSRHIPFTLKRRLWDSACAICGTEGDIEIDHILPFSRGGTSNEDSLQPLCRVCNAIKGTSRTNDDVREWIRKNPEKFRFKQQLRVERRQAILRQEWW